VPRQRLAMRMRREARRIHTLDGRCIELLFEIREHCSRKRVGSFPDLKQFLDLGLKTQQSVTYISITVALRLLTF
jgi:hypothetical protein